MTIFFTATSSVGFPVSCLGAKIVRVMLQGHEGEILTLTPIGSTDFVSTSLDQTVNVWDGAEGKLRATLPGPQEPIHCVAINGEEVITGSTANRY